MSKYDQLKAIVNTLATQHASGQGLQRSLSAIQREIVALEEADSKPAEKSLVEQQEAIVQLLQIKFLSAPHSDTAVALSTAIAGLKDLRSTQNGEATVFVNPSEVPANFEITSLESAIKNIVKRELAQAARPGGVLRDR